MSASNKKKLRKELKAAAMTEKQVQEQREAKKTKAYTLTFAIVMILVVAVVVGVLVTPYIQGGLRRLTHAVTIGNHELTSDELTYYYIDAISSYQDEVYNQYYSYYGNYWYYMLGFDTTLALNKQVKDSTTNQTWADYFVELAVDNAHSVYALYDDAMAKGFKLSEADQKDLDDSLASMSTYASYNNFSSVNAYLRDMYGPSANEKAYADYYTMNTIASAYYNEYMESIEYTDEDYRAFEKDKEHEYNSYSYVYYMVAMSSYLGEGTKDESGTTVWTDAEKEEARKQVEADKAALLASEITDKESFDKAVQALEVNMYDSEGNPVEDGSKKTATEAKDYSYANIYLTTEAKEWIIEADRKAGDIEVFPIYDTADYDDENKDDSEKTINGYYVVLFSECDKNEVHLANVRHILVKFTGGTEDEDGNVTYSEAENNIAKGKAESLLNNFKESIADETDSAKIEEKFAELANQESDDQGGEVTNGGIYEDIYPGQMVEAFEDWCFDESRKPGDTGLVETEYGWHVMFYSSTDELTYRDYIIKDDMLTEDLTEWHEGLMEKAKPTIVNLSFLELDYVLGQ